MNHYVCKIATTPTVYTAGTVYQAFINTDILSVRVRKMHLQLDSADTGGSPTGNSVFRFARCYGMPSNGTQLVPTKFNTGQEPSKMICLRNQAGLDMTGVIVDAYFMERSIIAKTTGSASNIEFDSEDDGFILAPNEGIIIAADNTVLQGSGVYGCIEWTEE